VADTAVDTDNLLNTAAVMDSNLVMAVDTAVAMVADTAVEWVVVTSAAIMAAIWAVDTDNNPLVTAVSMVGIILNEITINDPKPSQDLL
jgi:hypothetical protein